MITDTTEKIDYSLSNTPWYYGSYLNMARHNVFLLINHLSERFPHLKFKPIKNDAEIDKDNILTSIFDPSNKSLDIDRIRVYKYLLRRHHLPFIRIFHNDAGGSRPTDATPVVDFQQLHLFIKEVFKRLVSLRDSFSHYLALDENYEPIKNRDLGVSEIIKKEISNLFYRSPEFSLQRFASTQQERDYEHLEFYKLFKENSTTLTEHGLYFFINLFLERKQAIKFLKKIKGFKNETIPAFRATIQVFATYSLKVPDLKLDNDNEQMSILMEMLNELQKCPVELYNHLSEEDQQVFKPDLAEESKSNILLSSTNYEEVSDEDIDSLLTELSTLKRHQDRFPYFALRCIDELNLLPRVRFQLSLGRVEVRSYPKMVGAVEINRRILKDINVFGKLSVFENKEGWCTEKLNNYRDENDFIFDQFYPHYNIENNKIAFYLLPDTNSPEYILPAINNDKIGNAKPTGFLSIAELSKLLYVALESPHKAMKSIKEFVVKNHNIILSIEYLEKLRAKINQKSFSRRVVNTKKIMQKGRAIYLNDDKVKQLIKKYNIKTTDLDDLSKTSEIINRVKPETQKEYIRQIIYKHHINKRTSILDQLLVPKGLSAKQLPRQVQNYLLNIKVADSDKFLEARIKTIVFETKLKKKELAKSFKSPSDGARLKLGDVATFLARDIVDMLVHEDLKTKITTPFYTQLQHGLAYFSMSKDTVLQLLQSLNVFKFGGHPFLKQSHFSKAQGLLDFYETYLEDKLIWLNRQMTNKGKLQHIDSLIINLPFTLRSLWEKKSSLSFDKWLQEKKKMPVDLPRGLFDEAAITFLHSKLDSQSIAYKNTDRFSVLLAQSFNQDAQPFYKFKRLYKVDGEEVPFYPEGRDSKAIKTGYGRYAESNEKTIRFIQTQDRICKLLCLRIIESLGSFTGQLDIRLQDLLPFQNASLLNMPVCFKQAISFKRKQGQKKVDDKVYIVAQDNEQQRKSVSLYKNLASGVEREAYEGQKGYEWTVRDFGRFKKFVHDRRLPNIAAYIESKKLSFSFLEYQLSAYDFDREKVFKATFELEKHLADNFFENLVEVIMKENKKERMSSVQFKYYLEILADPSLFKDVSADNVEQLRDIRNKFSHSEFPELPQSFAKITALTMQQFDENRTVKKEEREEQDLSISTTLYSSYVKLIQAIVGR